MSQRERDMPVMNVAGRRAFPRRRRATIDDSVVRHDRLGQAVAMGGVNRPELQLGLVDRSINPARFPDILRVGATMQVAPPSYKDMAAHPLA